MSKAEELSEAKNPLPLSAPPHICIVDELEGLEIAVCKINALIDRVLGNSSDIPDIVRCATTMSLNDFLQNTPDRLVSITSQIESNVSKLEETLFS